MGSLSHMMARQGSDMEARIRLLEVLKHHEQSCADSSCECKEKGSASKQEYSQRDSMMSRTALLTIVDNKSPVDASQNSFIKSHREPSHGPAQPVIDETQSRRLIKFAIRVHEICQPMRFIRDQELDEPRVMMYIKYCFNQAIHAFQYNHNTKYLETVSLKYITFMSAYKHNSPAALSRLKQIQGRSLSYSNFFRTVCAVLESQLVEDIKMRHPQSESDEARMQVDEIWRLEQSKEIIVGSIVRLLKQKTRMWENLCSGETATMDRFMVDILDVSQQLERSRVEVQTVVDDFDEQVQHTYTYYHKYQCFQALFFDADYKRAAMFQRRMEDAWTLSKASLREGELGNYHWLQGDIATLEVSVSLMQGQILKGVAPRLMEFLGFKTMEDMEQQLKLRGTLSNSTHALNVQLSALMPPFLTCSHSFYIQRFLQRGHTPYIQRPMESFVCDCSGFISPVHVHLNFNFKNTSDFTMLGALLRKREEEDYLIFDEWGRILGITQKLFKQMIVKGALEEFGLAHNKNGYLERSRKVDRQEQLKKTLVTKIAHDERASLFKKAITTNFANLKSMSHFSNRTPKRTYIKPSDILIRFGSVQHFIPELAKQMTQLISNSIFKQLQKDSQAQMEKYLSMGKDAGKSINPQQTFLKQMSFLPDRQNSIGPGLSSNMIDKSQYRNFVISNYISGDGLMMKNMPVLQDEKVTLYVPKNYNELIDYYNDAGERFQDNHAEVESRSIRRMNIQSKYSYLPQEQVPTSLEFQQCQHIFDAEFQEFIDSKVKKYYSKALLKEAIENAEAKVLEMVRFKTLATVDVGIGGINENDQFLYFVCKLTSMNLMTAKRKDVLKIHLKKERQQRFDGDPEIRKSLLQLQSQESFGHRYSKDGSLQPSSNLDPHSIPSTQPAKHHHSLIGSSIVKLSRDGPQEQPKRNNTELPTKKPFSFISRMKQQKEQQSTESPNVVSLKIPNGPNEHYPPPPTVTSTDSGPQLRMTEGKVPQPQQISDYSFESSKEDIDFFNRQQENGSEVQQLSKQTSKQMSRQFSMTSSLQVPKQQRMAGMERPPVPERPPERPPAVMTDSVEHFNSEEQVGTPIKKLNIGFLQKMEKAFQRNRNSSTSSVASDERKSSIAGSFLTTFLQRLNLRRLSNSNTEKKDVFEQNPDMGFNEQSDESDHDDEPQKSNQNIEDDRHTPSGSNSMNSNNFSRMDGQDEEENMVQEDELKNIFEVMSQASNQQSVKSVSAIALATNISIRCKDYMPKQAATLQILKVVLVMLNLGGLVSLMIAGNLYFDHVFVGGLGQSVVDVYTQSMVSLHASNTLEQANIIVFPDLASGMLHNATMHAYELVFDLRDELIHHVMTVRDAVQFPIGTQKQSVIDSLDSYVTDLNILVDGLEIIAQNSESTNQATRTLYLDMIESLMQQMLFRHGSLLEIAEQINTKENDHKEFQAAIVVYLMIAFVAAHLIVIFVIVPFVKQINDIYGKVLMTLSRVTLEECQDEMKKLTLCQHLLETNDDHWVTSNQVKLIFYNKSKDLDLNEKYKQAHTRKGNQFFSLRLSDSSLMIWKDMVFYITISALSIAYLLIASLTLQNQQSIFNSFTVQYNDGVVARSHLTSLIAKLSITPERYLEDRSLRSQQVLEDFTKAGFLDDLLQSLQNDSLLIKEFNQQTPIFFEDLNIRNHFNPTKSKINVNQIDFKKRQSTLQSQSLIERLNHLMKDNLCYYNVEDVCEHQEQRDVYNTGLVGALDQLGKFVMDLDERQPDYYLTIEYRDLIMYGNRIILTSMDQLLLLMEAMLIKNRDSKIIELNTLYLGLGVPLVLITIILAGLEVYFLRRKVKRVIFAITYLPTFKFQDKIVLALIKAILKI